MLTSGSILAPPKLPGIAGFWARAGAFVLDVLFLHFAVRLLAPLAGDLPFQHPTAATGASAVLVFAYFIVCDSAIGARIAALATRSDAPVPSATLGKFLLGLRVTDLDGNIASVRAVALRYGILFAFVPLLLAVGYFHEGGPMDPQRAWVYNMATAMVTVSMLVGHAIACAFNAFKQGMHDFAAQTIVRKSGEEWLGFDALTTQLGDFWRMHYRQPQLSAAISAGLVYVSLGLLTWPKPDPGQKDLAEAARTMWTAMDAAVERQPLLAGAQPSTVGFDLSSGASPQTTPTLTLALHRNTLWTSSPTDPALAEQLRQYARDHIALVADSPLRAKDFEGTFTLRVRTLSHAYLLVHMATRDHAQTELEVYLPPVKQGS